MSNEGLTETLESIPVDRLTPGQNSEDNVISQLEAILDPEPVKKEEVQEEVEEVESEEEETEEAESEEEETEEVESEEEETEEAESEEEDTIELSEEQIASVLGAEDGSVKLSEEGELQFRVKVDKEESFVSLTDLTTSYQLEKHLRNKSSKDAEARREFQEFKTQESEKLSQQVTDATALVSYLEQQLTTQYSQEQLNQLRATNPSEWAAVNQEIQNQGTVIANIKANIQGVLQEQQSEVQKQQAESMKAYVDKQTELLYEALPTWMDEDVAAKEYTAMKDAAIATYGFTEEEMLKINDHRLVRVMLDALKGSTVKAGNPLKKRLKTVPKIVRSSSPKVAKKAANRKRKQQQRARVVKEHGSVDSIAAILVDRI